MKNGSVVIDDTDMSYVSFGKGEKTLVVLPGLSDGLSTVKGKALILSLPYRSHLQDYTVYMFSRKDAMPEGYSIRDMASDQIRALKELGIEETYVLGVSQGGMIAQYMAIDHPETVKKLILAVTASHANETIKENVSNWISMAEKKDHTALMCDSGEKMYSERYLQKNRKFFPLLARFTKPADYDRFLKNAYAILGFDDREELDKISCPVYIIGGSEDHTVGKDASRDLHERIKSSELFIYEGLGHGAYEEAEDFYERVFAFCDRRQKGI